MSLVARHLEARGIATVIIGSAIDIVEHCGVPRFLFTDFPLGNPCGVPYDRAMQTSIVESALELLESATEARTTWHSPHRFSADDSWRQTYLAVRDEDRTKLAQAGAARRQLRSQQKSIDQQS